MSKTNSFSGQVYTSQSAALTALIDAKGNDYKETSTDTYYWQRKGNEFADGPYRIVKTTGGKWVIL